MEKAILGCLLLVLRRQIIQKVVFSILKLINALYPTHRLFSERKCLLSPAKYNCSELIILPQPVLLSWLGAVLQTERWLVGFHVGAHAWGVGSAPSQGIYGRQPIDVSFLHQCFSPSLSPTFPLSLP